MATHMNENQGNLYAGILDIVCTTGERLVRNDEIENKYGLSADYILRRTGIEQRYFRTNETSFSELALKSVRSILERNGVSANQLVSIICTSSTFDKNSPSLACRILNEIDKDSTNEYCTAFDISAACAGFIYALEIGIEKLNYRRNAWEHQYVLVVTCETFSDFISHPTSPYILFADASSATLLQVSKTPNLLWKARINDVVTGSSRDLSNENQVFISNGVGKIDMNGRQVFESAVKKMSKSVYDICEKCGLGTEDIELYIFHQANKKIIDTIQRNLETRGNFYTNIDKFGNTGSTSIPLCLEEIFNSGEFGEKPLKTVLSAFGFGFTHGSASIDIFKY